MFFHFSTNKERKKGKKFLFQTKIAFNPLFFLFSKTNSMEKKKRVFFFSSCFFKPFSPGQMRITFGEEHFRSFSKLLYICVIYTIFWKNIFKGRNFPFSFFSITQFKFLFQSPQSKIKEKNNRTSKMIKNK